MKPADNGSGIVVQNVSNYKQEIYRQLSDTTVYKAIPSDPTTQLCKTLAVIVDRAPIEGTMNKKLPTLIPNNARVIYTLPKVSKNLRHPPWCPIVSGTPFSKLSLNSWTRCYDHMPKVDSPL